jgi:predicted ATPase/class 3 adenylate cyclase
MGAPSGTVTFLFTDIEGSTKLWQLDEAAMGLAVSRHDELLRATILECGGAVFSAMGDGFAAAFTSAHAALRAAELAQERLTQEEWSTAEPVRVRMGLHTGEAEERHGDYFGTAVNRAARLMAVGHGGQILCSSATAELLDGDVVLVDLGEHRLRDLDRSLRVFQIGEGRFPPLRSWGGSPGNLRAPPTSFVGRAAEQAELVSLVQAHRLVTLTGVGGVGKTRLALEVAGAVAAEFPDGVWVVELGPVGDPAAVPDAVAATLGIVQQAGLGMADSVAAALAGRRRLLVVDNCEHVLDAAAELIDAVLARSPTPKVLATSREGLHAAEEQLWPVPSLDTRAGIASDAAALFVGRARAVAPSFESTTPEDQSAVVEICRRLDGIPLAIELAASRMVSMTPAEVRDRLGDRFRLLAGPRRGLARHQTLRHAVVWSYDLLSPAEQRLLACCSVFAGGFDLAAATAVAAGPERPLDDYSVLDGLDGLVRKSLLAARPAAGRTRYTMLETVRAFAEEHLIASDLAEEARRRHAEFYADQQGPVLALWDGPRQCESYEWLSAELANLRTAFRWTADHGDLDIATTIAVLASFLGYPSQHFEPFSWSEELIGAARAVDHPQLVALYAMAGQCVLAGRLDDSLRFFEATEPLWGDPRYSPGPFGCARPWIGASRLLAELGGGDNFGDPDRSVELCRAEIDRSGDPTSYARAALVIALTVAGRDDEARTLAPQVVEAAEPRGNPFFLAYALMAYAMACRETDSTAVMAALRRGLEIAHQSGNSRVESNLQIILADLEVSHGHRHDALDLLESAITSYHDSGDMLSLRSPLASLAVCLDRMSQPEAAATIAGSAQTNLTVAVVRTLPAATAHLRQVLGDQKFETFAARGAALEPTDVVSYALEQIDHARAKV